MIRTEQYTIPRRWFSSLPPITVEISCAADTPAGVRLGMAVRVAVGQKANLRDADLRGADLCYANLRDAVLRGADLRGAVLRGADLCYADLCYADLCYADLRDAVLRGADLCGAVLRGADLRDAVLRGADLCYADLRDAVLRGEKVTRCFARIERDDGYTFIAFELEAGGMKIAAGCRWFTLAEFRAHVAEAYPNTPKAVETLWILEAIERRADDLGIPLSRQSEAA